MDLARRVAFRHLARSAPKADYFEDEIGGALDTIKGLRRYGAGLAKARDLLRPVVECLRSKALGKIYVALDEAIGHIPTLVREMEGIIANLLDIDQQLVEEQRRLTHLARSGESIALHDIRVPTADLAALVARIAKYNATHERLLDDAYSLEDIGTAGSRDLIAFERAIEKLESWEEINHAPEVSSDGWDEAVLDRVHVES